MCKIPIAFSNHKWHISLCLYSFFQKQVLLNNIYAQLRILNFFTTRKKSKSKQSIKQREKIILVHWHLPAS